MTAALSDAQQAQQDNRNSNGSGRYAEGQHQDPGQSVVPEATEPQSFSCYHCGNPMAVDANEVSGHVDENGQPDYDADLSHAAVADHSFDEPSPFEVVTTAGPAAVVPDAGFATADVFTVAARLTSKESKYNTDPYRNVLLHDGHVYASDRYSAIRIRSAAADDAWQLAVDGTEAKKAAAGAGDSKVRISGAFIELGGEPIFPTDGYPLRNLPSMFDNTLEAEPVTMKVTALTRLAGVKGKTVINGWAHDNVKLKPLVKAMKDLGVKDVTVSHGRTSPARAGRDIMQLSAPGVDAVMVARRVPA